MKKLFFFFVLSSFLYSCSSCGSHQGTEGGLRKGEGGIYYGGVLRLNEVEDFRNLYPLDLTQQVSHHIVNQVYEGLVKLNQADLSAIPAVAESWTKNDNATVWTFKIRKGIKFHDDECFEGGKGREVTAKDFKWCFEKLCTASPHNQMYSITFKDRVIGANEFFESTQNGKPLADGVKGVKVLDDYTLEIDLSVPFAGFLNILSTPGCYIFPKEALDKYGEDGLRAKCVGSGPFKIKTVKEGEAVLMERNADYWGKDEHGNQLPYLDVVRYSFIKEKKQEILEFRKGNLDMVYQLPIENIQDILSELDKAKENKPFVLQVTPAMRTDYYGFLNPVKPFADKRVRLAFNHAIDRTKIIDYTLKGEGVPALNGFVPPVKYFENKGYDFSKLKGYTFNPDEAKKLLSEAGYPNGKGFPKTTLLINSGGGDRNVLTAQVVQSMLKENLNIDVDIEMLPQSQELDKIESGKAMFWRSAWVADYPDPETFLTLLYSKHIPAKLDDRSYVNSVRFRSAKFDSLFSLAMKEVDDKKRFELYEQADQVIIDDAPVMPIFYDEIYRLVQKNVRNFFENAMEYRDVSRVYFVPEEGQQAKK